MVHLAYESLSILLTSSRTVDGHNDLPYVLRQQLKSKIYDHDFLNTTAMTNHTDIGRMKKGLMGGQFWSVYMPNPRDMDPNTDTNDDSRPHPPLNEPNWAVRDTLEQIDVTKRMVAHYPNDLQLCTDPASVRAAHASGKIASMLGVEGGHQTGNSLGTLRMFFESGVRYMTITHNSDNAFGTSWISVDLKRGIDAGLTKFGESCIAEMNRMGMMVDLSHVSPNTMRRTLDVTKAPVIFSHSGSYSVTKHLRNAPDDVILRVKENGGILMVPAVTRFVSDNPEEATVEDLIDHIMYIANLIGWEHVGLGSDFDGTTDIVKGLEVSIRGSHKNTADSFRTQPNGQALLHAFLQEAPRKNK